MQQQQSMARKNRTNALTRLDMGIIQNECVQETNDSALAQASTTPLVHQGSAQLRLAQRSIMRCFCICFWLGVVSFEKKLSNTDLLQSQASSMEGPPGPQNEGRSSRGHWENDEMIPTPPLLSPRAPATPRGVPQSPRTGAALPHNGPEQQQAHRCATFSSQKAETLVSLSGPVIGLCSCNKDGLHKVGDGP